MWYDYYLTELAIGAMMKCMKQAIILCLLLGACAQEQEIAAEADQVPEFQGELPCSRVYTPRVEKLDDPTEALDAMHNAATRWSAAMSCDISIGEGGTPIVAWPSLFAEEREDGRTLLSSINHGGTMRHLCGLATWNDEDTAVKIIDVSGTYMDCDAEWATLHEMWHDLVGVKGHMEAGIGAAGDDPDKSPFIDADSLSAVCAHNHCSVQQPEI